MIEPNSWPRGMKRKIAEAYVGGERNLLVLKHFFDLRPTICHHRNTTYSKDRVDAAWTRADQEGWPTPDQISQIIRK